MWTVRIQATYFDNSEPSKVELDLHADTCVVGENALIVHDLCRPVNVYRYHPEDRGKQACTVDAAVAYDDPQTGDTFDSASH